MHRRPAIYTNLNGLIVFFDLQVQISLVVILGILDPSVVSTILQYLLAKLRWLKEHQELTKYLICTVITVVASRLTSGYEVPFSHEGAKQEKSQRG